MWGGFSNPPPRGRGGWRTRPTFSNEGAVLAPPLTMHLQGLLRVVVIAPVAYLALALVIRVAGKRVLANMNPFDMLVTVAVGSTIATFVLDQQVKFWQGMLALMVPLALQFAVAWLASHSERLERAVKQYPAMLVWNGEMLPAMLHHEMITEDEVREAARKA